VAAFGGMAKKNAPRDPSVAMAMLHRFLEERGITLDEPLEPIADLDAVTLEAAMLFEQVSPELQDEILLILGGLSRADLH
jgi:hypothetical protein